MSKLKVSIADNFYDRCCLDYTLRLRDIGRYTDGALAGVKSRISSYRIGNVGAVTIIRAEGTLGMTKTESCIFTPMEKDAPILMVDDVKRWFKKETLSINVVKCQVNGLTYRQFENLSELYAKLADADVPAMWYNSLLVRGSVAKEGSREELAAMLEEYMNAYLRIVQFAEKASLSDRTEKIKEFSHRFLTEGGAAIEAARKGLGGESEEFLDKAVFPLQ